MSESAPTSAETRRIAEAARDRVRFEEEALELSDQVYRVARRLVGTRGGGGGPDAGDVRAGLPLVAAVPAGDEPARVAAPDPHEPQHRPRPANPAPAGRAAARGRRLLPLQPARVDDRGRQSRRGARARPALAEH